ncbi:MAG TPA: hypothetical protein VM370_09285 [Candidatus Thermoplasmatota archaeon]|nr:hypothetical protein [Candidatus Thermoplasmatota archaeon]
MTSTPRYSTRLIIALVCVTLLAGCIGAKGEVETKSINLAYDGDQSGSHQITGACDSEGTLTGSGKITDGSVRVQVFDGSGNSRFDKTYTTDFTLASQEISGASGTWKITGERSGDDLVGDQFQGSYTVTQRC